MLAAIAINESQSGQLFWRTLTSQVDTIIKASCTAQVIPLAHTIAMEVIKRGQESNVEDFKRYGSEAMQSIFLPFPLSLIIH